MKDKAFTVVELLVSIAIIVLIAALLFPVFSGAKEAAKVPATKEKLHQLWIATSLYRSAHDGDSKYGPHYEMGLPSVIELIGPIVNGPMHRQPLAEYTQFSKLQDWVSPCQPNPMYDSAGGYLYRPGDSTEPAAFIKEVTARTEDYMLFIDPTCSSKSQSLENKFFTHHILGVRLSGALYDKSKKGRPMTDPNYWY
jgi:prepilin-type N-terminal cleavage/methylation domain-containing protein